MFGLIPKEEKFFALFQEMTKNIVVGSQLLKKMLDEFSNAASIQHEIKNIEHNGDQLTHNIIKKLNVSFITPFDREDIHELASALDDILDLIDASAQHILMYKVDIITPPAKELGFIIQKACENVHKAVLGLGKKYEHIAEYCVEINSLENEADRVRQDAITKLFDEEKDPIKLIKWKEIYETLEHVTDKCEDAANILESVVLKDA